MTTTSLDLSGKIDKFTLSAFVRIHQISSSLSIPFFIVGATARDILLEVYYGIGSKRATIDIDIAVLFHNLSICCLYFANRAFLPKHFQNVITIEFNY